jgi:putative two-component system response regulator
MDQIAYYPPNILIIDDVNANLVVLTEMIRNAGYIARPVTSARQAVSAIEALTPNLILLDISMPEIDGFVFCSMLKKNANTRDIPVIFISALSNTEDRIRGFQLGAVDYISKPFEAEEVILRINTHLKIYKMQQELELYNKKLYKIINDQIRKIYDEQRNVILALSKMLLLRDETKNLPMGRIGKNSRLLAMSLQLSAPYRDEITNSFIDTIELTAPLHDIGEIAMEDSILFKASELNEQELERMRLHREKGLNSLKEIYSLNEHNEFIHMAIEIAGSYLENWDGTGYPVGLFGTQIPLSARIVAIIGEYDNLISDKGSHTAYSHEESITIINEKAGSRFDPNIVKILNKIQYQLRR